MWSILLSGMFVGVGGCQGSGAKLEIVNPRGTYGEFGATRPKTGMLPGDVAHFSFDVKNLKLDEQGSASYSLKIEVMDGKGQVVYSKGPTNATAQSYFGGNSLPVNAHMAVPIDAPAGWYSLKVTVHDRAANQTAVFNAKGKVLPADFGLVHVGTFADRGGKVPTPPVGVVGQSLYVNFSAINFARTKDDAKQPDVHVSLRVLDDKGQPTFAKPLSGVVNKDVPADAKYLPMQFGVTLNRPGHFTIELSATCQLCGKTSRVTFPVRVAAPE